MSPTEFRKMASNAMLTSDMKMLRKVGARWSAMDEPRRRKILSKAKSDVYHFLIGVTAGIAVTAPGDLPVHYDGDGCKRCAFPGCRNAGHWGRECWEHNRWARDQASKMRDRAAKEAELVKARKKRTRK